MTTLFNLCEYEYFLTWKRICSFSVPNIQWEYVNQEIHIYLSLTTIQIKIPVVSTRYQESGDPDDIPF